VKFSQWVDAKLWSIRGDFFPEPGMFAAMAAARETSQGQAIESNTLLFLVCLQLQWKI
jgi:hypothetical protein